MAESLCQNFLPAYQKSNVKSLVEGLMVGGASSLLKQYPLDWYEYTALHWVTYVSRANKK